MSKKYIPTFQRQNTFYIQGRKELERAITFDEEKQYKHAVTHYIRAIEYHIAGYKRDKNVNHRNKIYKKIQSYIERAETVKVLKISIEEANIFNNNNKDTNSNDRIRSSSSSGRLPDTSATDGGNILFKDIKGLDYSKMALIESVILPQKQPQVLQLYL